MNNGATTTKYFVAGKRNLCHGMVQSILFIISQPAKNAAKNFIQSHDNRAWKFEKKKQLNARTEAAVAWMKRYFNLVVVTRCPIRIKSTLHAGKHARISIIDTAMI